MSADSKGLVRWLRAGCAALVLAMLFQFSFGSRSEVSAQAFLGTAADFAVLGGSAVTNTGASVLVDGDLGVWPSSTITGFPPGIVVPPGAIHAGDAVAQQAQTDLVTAYNTLAGMACDSDLTGMDLGGMTLTPGVYCFASTAQLTGVLTLDAQGDDQAEFVFQIGSMLTTATNSSVNVINAGQDCNVSWQIGSSATLGTNTDFVGNIVALTSITLVTGSSVSGRVLARNGAVTLDNNLISVPICLPPATITPISTNTLVPGAPTVTPTPIPPGPPPSVGGYQIGQFEAIGEEFASQSEDVEPDRGVLVGGFATLLLLTLAGLAEWRRRVSA